MRYNGDEITAPSTVPTYSVDSGTGVGTLTIPYNADEFRYYLESRFTGDSPTPPAGDTFTITTSVAGGSGGRGGADFGGGFGGGRGDMRGMTASGARTKSVQITVENRSNTLLIVVLVPWLVSLVVRTYS